MTGTPPGFDDGSPGDGPPEDGLVVTTEHDRLSLGETLVAAVIDAVCASEGVRVASLSVVLAGHDLVHAVNRDWLGHDYPTDVVSFGLDETAAARGVLDGEIYVDLDTAEERAPEFGATFTAEALRYVAHGALHIAGHDDATDDQRAAMRALEDRALAAAGVL